MVGGAVAQPLGPRAIDRPACAGVSGGSFVTSKEVPNDLDVLLVMDTGFVVEAVPAQA